MFVLYPPRTKFCDGDGYNVISIQMVNLIHDSTHAKDLNEFRVAGSVCDMESSSKENTLLYDFNSLGYVQEM